MVLNPGKCYYLTFGLNTIKNEFCLEDGTLVSSADEHVVLRMTTDSRLTFYSHINQLCKNVASKLNALTRIDLYFSHNQNGQLYYCPLMWTFCSRQWNQFISQLQERALRLIYNGYDQGFSELLEMSNETTIHIKNTTVLITERYTFLNDLSPPIMNETMNETFFRNNKTSTL